MLASHVVKSRCSSLSRCECSEKLFINLLVPSLSFHYQPNNRFAANETSLGKGKGKAKAATGKGGRRPDGDEQRSVNIIEAALKPAIIHTVFSASLIVFTTSDTPLLLTLAGMIHHMDTVAEHLVIFEFDSISFTCIVTG